MAVFTRKKRITLLLAALAAFAFMAHSTYRSLSRQKEEQRAPQPPLQSGMAMEGELALTGLDTKNVTLADYRGKVVLINFWAGWFGPFLHEMPGLFDLQKRLASRGFVVLGVNMDENPADGMRVLKKVLPGESPFPMFKGMAAPIAERFSLEGLPFTVVIDKNFKIIYAQAGEVDWGSKRARDLVEALL
ncbi:MAG: TlpA family protein disulfide reductase [Bdellovibrionota bacterium]